MSGRIILTILGKGWGFPGIGPPPTFWPFMVILGTVMALVGVSFSMLMYYNEHIMRVIVYWKLHLLPSWTQLVLTSFCHVLNSSVILLKVVPCPLPSCFRSIQLNSCVSFQKVADVAGLLMLGLYRVRNQEFNKAFLWKQKKNKGLWLEQIINLVPESRQLLVKKISSIRLKGTVGSKICHLKMFLFGMRIIQADQF